MIEKVLAWFFALSMVGLTILVYEIVLPWWKRTVLPWWNRLTKP